MSQTRIDNLSSDARAALERVINRFEDSWQNGTPPRLDTYLGDCPEHRHALVPELALVDLEYRLQKGEAARAEEYVQRFPEVYERSDLVMELVRREFELRCRREAPVNLDEYRTRFPEQAERLIREMAEVTTRDHVQSVAPAPPAPAPAAVSEESPPAGFGRYRVMGKVGSGGFGIVYRGYDEQLRREVAIKVPHRHRATSPGHVDAYLAEARALARLSHPGIVPVYDCGQDGGRCYLVSHFVEGTDLAARLKQGKLPAGDAAELIAQVAEALHHAHRHGLVHRDVKPANVLLTRDGKPVVADFGLALREEEFGKGSGYAGTPAYMSPEQARGEGHRVDARTDVYSLGVVLYELLTGRRPYQGATVAEVLEQIRTCEPRPPRQHDDRIPRELDRICLKALARRASDRYSTALDLAEDLRNAVRDGGAAIEKSPPAAPSSPPPSQSQPVLRPSQSGDPLRIVPRGLRAFDAADADFFLELLPGPRDRDGLPDGLSFWLRSITETDPERTFSVGLLYGPSGCGKSSLVKAGLVPRLPPGVVAVYLEATPDATESRLLRGLRKCCPDLPADLDLVGSLTHLRRRAASPHSKVLLVLDQFEQWLHARGGALDGELVEALRQCDGQHLQCLVLVRDDFWMAATRFLRELEVRLVEGQNSAAADLFDCRHARKVLAGFGRAFGCLPERPDDLHERFLDQAVAGLAEEGKVVPVRLALFAEMVKGRPWTPGTLREVGGMEGIGITFLEETFSAPTAPPGHRLHQHAARSVLRALLPAPGTDLKGHRRSDQELRQAAGYSPAASKKDDDFEGLLHILDTELRLVTPADEVGDAGKTPGTGGRYYQLTHDYLVPALRQWLTRKQRETRRGRAELLLAERAAAWNARPEWRQLPTPTEGLRILLHTRRRDWGPAERKMLTLRNWVRIFRPFLSAGLLCMLGVLGLWGLIEWAVSLRIGMLVETLSTANPAEVPAIVREMKQFRRWATPALEHLAESSPPGSKAHLNANLALLPTDPTRVDAVYERLLEAAPDDVPTLRTALSRHRDALIPRLWEAVENPGPDADRRLRAAAALATYDADSPRWTGVRSALAERLVHERTVNVGKWAQLLYPARKALTEPLAAIAADPQRREIERTVARDILGEFARGEPGAG